ncbi:MAG: transketolase [Crenarchaeota archaeon]|nr:transketolase [Thermoproteota archaeon]
MFKEDSRTVSPGRSVRMTISKCLRTISEKARTYLLLIALYNPGVHLGSALSVIEILTALYGSGRVSFLKGDIDRNWLILSKGHAVHAVYAIAAAMGYLSWSELRNSGTIGSPLQNHPELGTPGVDVAAGSLGQGVSMSVGIALGLRMRGLRNRRVYVIIGDGELDEGQTWEAFTTAAHYGLTNWIPIIDYNKIQLDGKIDDVKRKGDLRKRFEALGYQVVEVDGHDIDSILAVLEDVESSDKMSVIIAHTVRGKGVPVLENTNRQRMLREEILQVLKERML